MANLTTIVDNQIIESAIDEGVVITTASGLSSLSDVVLATPANGDFLMYNGTDWVDSTAVTSVSLSVPTGFTVSGVPITTTGTINLDLASGYSLINNTSQTITGAKTFSSAPVLSSITSSLLKTDASGVVSAAVLNTDYVSGNLYTANGTLTGNRTVTMGTNTLTFDINKASGSGVGISHTQTGANASDTGDQAFSLSYSITGSGGTQLVTRVFSLGTNNNRTSATVTNMRVFNLSATTNTSTTTTNLDQIYIERGSQNGVVTSNRAIVVATTQGTSQAVLVGQGLTGTNNTYVLLGTYNIPSGSWGIYQTQNTFNNYFNGKVLIGTTTDGGFNLDVNGTARITGNTTIANGVKIIYATTGGGSITATVNGQASQTLQHTVRLNPGSATLGVASSYANYLFDVATITEAGSGTSQLVSNVYVRPVTLVNGAGSTSVGASLYVENAPSGISFGNGTFSLWVDDGLTRLDGGVAIGGTSGSGSNLFVVGSTGTANNAMSIGGASTHSRVVIHQSAAPSMGGANYASLIVQGSAFVNTTHAIIAAAAIKAPDMTISGGTATNGVALYVEGATTLATNNYAVWVDNGTVRLDEAFELQGIANTTTSDVLYYNTTTKRVTYGTAPSGSGGYTVTSQTTTYSATATTGTLIIKCNTTGGAFTVNLPTAVGNTATFIIKKTAGSADLTVDAAGSETIDGGLTAILRTVDESITLISDNANWLII